MKTKVASGAASALLLTAATLVVSFVLMKLVVGHLTPDRAGFWFLLLSLSQFILFFDLGFSPTLTRTIALTMGSEQDVGVRNQAISGAISALRKLTYAATLIVFFVGAPLGMWLLPRWLNLPEFDTSAWILFLVGAATNLAGGVNLATLNGLGYVSTERLLRAGGQLLWLGTSFIALRAGHDLVGLAAAWTFQGIAVRSAAGFLIRRRHPELYARESRSAFAVQLAHLKEMFPPSVRWAITSLGALLILQTGNLVVAKVLGTSAIPPYEAINRMLAALMTLGILIASASSPFISRAYGANDHTGLKSLLFMNVRIGMAIVLGAAIFLLLHGNEIVSHWLAPELFAGNDVLYFGVAMAVLEVHHVILATAVMATGPVPFAAWAVGAGVLNLIFGFLLVPEFGLVGMAAATFAAQLLTNNWYAPKVALQRFAISIPQYFARALVRPMIAAAVLGAIGFAMKTAFENPMVPTDAPSAPAAMSLASLVVQAVIYIACAVIIGYLVIPDREEKSSMNAYLRKKFSCA